MDALELFAALAVFGGLAAVMAEIWLKDAAIFGEIASDLRAFADPSRELATRPAPVGRKAEPALAVDDGGLMQAA
ncbi:MAG TPA: hypothetical protein VHN20_04735 [Beijerinckiaceae bacterium]|nr:hypothetical protein [Beijerinckiaceae bacterium]